MSICGEEWGECPRVAYEVHECFRTDGHRGAHKCECGGFRSRRPPLKRKPKPKKPTKTQLTRKADDLAGARCRARGYCEMKVLRPQLICKPPLQWCHIISRSYRSTRWAEDNCLCGCSAHHSFFSTHPDAWFIALEKQWPGRHEDLWSRAQVQWHGNLEEEISALKSRSEEGAP